MVDPINTSGQTPPASLQSNTAEQEAVNRRAEQEQQTVQQTNAEDSVTIRSEAVASEQASSPTSIQNSEQAQQVAADVVNLFQQQPELAASAQGGRLSAEKADAFLTASIG